MVVGVRCVRMRMAGGGGGQVWGRQDASKADITAGPFLHPCANCPSAPALLHSARCAAPQPTTSPTTGLPAPRLQRARHPYIPAPPPPAVLTNPAPLSALRLGFKYKKSTLTLNAGLQTLARWISWTWRTATVTTCCLLVPRVGCLVPGNLGWRWGAGGYGAGPRGIEVGSAACCSAAEGRGMPCPSCD